MTNRNQPGGLPEVNAESNPQWTSLPLPSVQTTDSSTGPPHPRSTNSPTILAGEPFNIGRRAYEQTPYSQISDILPSLRSSLSSIGNITGIPIDHRTVNNTKKTHQIYQLPLFDNLETIIVKDPPGPVSQAIYVYVKNKDADYVLGHYVIPPSTPVKFFITSEAPNISGMAIQGAVNPGLGNAGPTTRGRAVGSAIGAPLLDQATERRRQSVLTTLRASNLPAPNAARAGFANLTTQEASQLIQRINTATFSRGNAG